MDAVHPRRTVSSTLDTDPLIRFVSRLVRTPSVLGSELAMAKAVVDEMRRLEFDEVEIDSAGNAVGAIHGEREGPTVLFDAHMDTIGVDPRDAWSRDPFSGDVADGRLHGRGSSDMKGALAAMVHGAATLDRRALAGRVVVSASVGEELIEGAALEVVMKRRNPDYVVIGEASGLDLVRAGRGRAELVVRTIGRPAHASSPELGDNAVHTMCRVLEEIQKLKMPAHPFVGRGVVCLTALISEPYPGHSVVPSGCRATVERRLVPGDTLEGLVDDLTAACLRAGAPDTEISLATTDYTTYTGIRWDQPKWFPPWELAESHELVRTAITALRSSGLEPKLTSYRFCTNAAYSAGVAGVPTVGFGPSTEDLVHIVDESVDLEHLIAASLGYHAIAGKLLGGGA